MVARRQTGCRQMGGRHMPNAWWGYGRLSAVYFEYGTDAIFTNSFIKILFLLFWSKIVLDEAKTQKKNLPSSKYGTATTGITTRRCCRICRMLNVTNLLNKSKFMLCRVAIQFNDEHLSTRHIRRGDSVLAGLGLGFWQLTSLIEFFEGLTDWTDAFSEEKKIAKLVSKKSEREKKNLDCTTEEYRHVSLH